MTAIYIWLIIGIILLILEIFFPGFVLLSFGVGCICSSIAALFGLGTNWQLLIFVITTTLIFFGIKPILVKVLYNPDKEVKTNVDALTGLTGTVIETIEKDGTGRVVLGGEEWMAVADKNQKYEVGCKVKVLRIEGTKVFVTKENEEG
jgi:membrane protein implicated in regulation of membrane protease activity